MKASELIEELRRKIEDYGDWEISAGIKYHPVLDEETNRIVYDPEQYPVSEIRVTTKRDGQQKRFIIE